MTDFNPKEYKVVALRDCPVPEEMQICEEPRQVADYWLLPDKAICPSGSALNVMKPYTSRLYLSIRGCCSEIARR